VTILTDTRVVQEDQVVEGGWVRWEGERLADVGRGHLPVDRYHSPAAGWSSRASSTSTTSATSRRGDGPT
jgi:hypothetical protein